MTSSVSVGISEFKVAKAPTVLTTYGLGSCVGIAIYDPATREGALAHTLLPAPIRDAVVTEKTAKYTGAAVELMVEELLNRGCALERLVAKLAGGASMFDSRHSSFYGGIGERNVAAAKSALERHGIALVGEDTGEDYGRSLEFSLATGDLAVRALQRATKII